MIFSRPLLLATLLLLVQGVKAQDDDMSKLMGDDTLAKEAVSGAFKSSRVIMSQSMEMLKPGVLDFRILHRFGNVNSGLSNFFGLDQASIRLGLDYGISNKLTIGIGRGTYRKEIDGFIKYRPIQQEKGSKGAPVSLLAVVGSTIIGSPWEDPSRKNAFSSRLSYYGQLIVGRKFSDVLTIQLMPTVVHRNLVKLDEDPHDVYAAGLGARLKLSKRVALTLDYYYVFNQDHYYIDTDPANRITKRNPLSIGFDIETGGHVFQLHFTNAVGMNERVFLTETTNNWWDGDIQFGFNISRAFQLRKKKS